MLIDWQDPAPVDGFDTVDLPEQGWTASIAPWAPYTAAQLWPAYARYTALAPDDGSTPDQWAGSVVDAGGAGWIDRTLAILAVADADRDRDALMRLGAHIYGNDATFFRRLWAEVDAGILNPAVVSPILAMERPEYFDAETLAVFLRLQGRCMSPR